jgi:preprotein translocase subunit SecF
VAIGAYSSIFIATPILAQLKEREPAMQALAKRVSGRAGGGGKAAARGTTVTSRRAAAAAADEELADDELEQASQPEPAAAVARAANRPAPARRPGQPQRSQPRKGKNRPGGKKRR